MEAFVLYMVRLVMLFFPLTIFYVFDIDRSLGSGGMDCITLRGHGGVVYSTCFTHDNQFVISASEDTTRMSSSNLL